MSNTILNLAHSQPVLQTDVYHQSITVTWDFPIVFTRDIFAVSNEHFLQTLIRNEPDATHKLIVFLDEGVARSDSALISKIKSYCHRFDSLLNLVCDPVILPGGESVKNDPRWLTLIQETIFQHRLDRHSHVIAIGGGALLDAAGMAAAVSHRGIRHTRIPTTVLAQNDSGVGVKNGVNHFNQKNYMGTFAPPYAVINDYRFIEHLPAREKIAGMAEAIKVALIRDDKFYRWLEDNVDALISFDTDAMQHMIRRCAELHMNQISKGGDPFEMGSARPLDFGHWSAHKLEIMSGYNLRHGEAVAIGMSLDAHYSVLTGLLAQGEDERIYRLLERLGFTLWHDALGQSRSDGVPDVVAGIDDFQEHLGGDLTLTLLESIGKGKEVHQMDKQLIADSIEWLRLRHERPTFC